MAQQWQPGVQYNYGDVVVFEGVQYNLIQAHRSQSDWTPPVTPALWGRSQGACCQEKYGGDCNPGQGCGQQQPQQQYQGDNQQSQPAGGQSAQGQKESWFEEHKKGLEIGGGLLAGAAVLGAGFKAFQHHANKQEEKQARAWSAGNWAADSIARTQQWRAGQYREPVAWIWNEGRNIPHDAIQGGEEKGQALYICRVFHEGGLLVGKASRALRKGAVIGFKKDEIEFDKYEILVGNSRAVRWVSTAGQLNLQNLRARPVEGGREPDGAAIYVAQAPYHGAVHPGKACEIYGDGCFIPYDNAEKKVKEYAILCYA